MILLPLTKNRDRLPAVSFFSGLLFCLYLVAVPSFDILPWFGKYNEKRILELLLLFVVVLLFVCNSSSRENWLSTLGHLSGNSKAMLLFIAALGVFSSLNASFPKFALLELSLFILLFAASICIASCSTQLGDHFDNMMAIALFVMAWLYLSAFSGAYLRALSTDTVLSQSGLFNNFSNLRFFNQLQSWTLSLIVLPSLFFTNRAPFLRALFIAIAIGWWLLLFTSGCRGTLFGCLIAIPATLLIFGKQATDWFRWQAIALVGGLAAYILFFIVFPEIISVDVKSTTDRDLTGFADRLHLWSSAAKMVQAQPWLGSGPMHFAAAGNAVATHPHNSVLQIAAEWGVPVAIMVIALCIGGLCDWLKTGTSFPSSQKDKDVFTALFASLMTAAVHSIFSGIVVMPVSQVMMALVVGWMIGISVRASGVRKDHSRLQHVMLCLIFPVAVAGVIWPLFPEVLSLEKSQAEFLDSQTERNLKPRFWQQGDLRAYSPTLWVP